MPQHGIRHRTSRRWFTEHHAESPAWHNAMAFDDAPAADQYRRRTLDDFADAWAAEPLPAEPVAFTGAWGDIPLEVRRFLTQRLLDQALTLHDGPAGMIKFLYAGRERDGLLMSRSYTMSPLEFWPFVLEDARAWTMARAKKEEAHAGS